MGETDMKKNSTETAMKIFWENCPYSTAHIGDRISQRAIKGYIQNCQPHISLDEKTVIDYGTGGGGIGEYITRIHRINKYIGIDISQRSIDVAKKRMSKFRKKEFYLTPVEFGDLGGDIFISLAVIQHFPDLHYTIDFFENLNRSKIPELFLQHRHADPAEFIGHKYKAVDKVLASCKINIGFMRDLLTNYNPGWISPVSEVSKYQYSRWVLCK
jgi:SAM-dependent methyltransferase